MPVSMHCQVRYPNNRGSIATAYKSTGAADATVQVNLTEPYQVSGATKPASRYLTCLYLNA
jgi:hypothetical protein